MADPEADPPPGPAFLAGIAIFGVSTRSGAPEVSRRPRASERHLVDLLRCVPEAAAAVEEIFGPRPR